MPSIADAIIPDNGLEGYRPVAAPRPAPISVPAPAPPSTIGPGRNSMLRCPMPALWAASPDALRQFYLDGQVPQSRTMLPSAPVSISTGSVTENIQVTSTGGGSASTSQSVGFASTVAVIKTPVLPPGNKYVGSALLAKSFQLLALAAQSPCRVQLYGTASAQSADLTRDLDAPPAAGTAQNIICDVVLDTVPYSWSFQNRIGANADSPQTTSVYVTITNLDQTSDKELLTVQYVPLES